MPGMDSVSLVILTLLISIFLFAGLVHGTLGMGFPMTATPMLALVTDVRSAILITILPTIAVNILSIYRGGHWRHSLGEYWPLAIYVAIGSVVGTELLIYVDPAPFKLLLAAVILVFLNLNRFDKLRLHWIINHPKLALLLFGLVAGFLAGTVNVMVPILIILFLELDAAPTAMVQVFNMCFLTGKVIQGVIFSYTGILDTEILLTTTPFAIAGILTLLLGMEIRTRVDAHTYRGWMNKFLWVVALGLIVQYFIQS